MFNFKAQVFSAYQPITPETVKNLLQSSVIAEINLGPIGTFKPVISSTAFLSYQSLDFTNTLSFSFN
jgi:hypothetical protein